MQLYTKLEKYLNNGKNFYRLYFFLVIFLCIVKLPSLFSSDIQPWDEGMYATRVLSIHQFGDWLDQSSHSVGGFYSASHPPLLIWTASLVTLVFGTGSIVLKLIIFLFALGCVLLIMKTGQLLFSTAMGFYAALIFTSNIIFTVFSQRFQLDIPYTFFILASFYFFFRHTESHERKYLVISGIAFGCCLMTKILVGFYIPIILVISFVFLRKKLNISFKSIVFVTITGIVIALPWHLYMLMKFGNEFTDYFFGFHIYDRALHGVEHNEKNSGALYHVNYLLSIIPYSILVFISCVRDLKQFNQLEWKKIFLYIWFITGLFIITVFRTKLEVYVLLILLPACFIIPLFIGSLNNTANRTSKTLLILLTILNIIWFATEAIRPQLKQYSLDSKAIVFLIITGAAALLISIILSAKIELKKAYYLFILIFFFAVNLYYLFFIPDWVNRFKLSDIKKYIDKSGKTQLIYVSPGYRYNPQFSYYFEGLNLGWSNSKYSFELIDSIKHEGSFEKTKFRLGSHWDSNYFIILEKDGINRASDYYPELFIPYYNTLVKEERGYKLYEKIQ